MHDIINEIAKEASKSKKAPTIKKEEVESSSRSPKPFFFKKERVVNVFKGAHLPQPLADKIRALAHREQMSESALIRNILESWLADHA